VERERRNALICRVYAGQEFANLGLVFPCRRQSLRRDEENSCESLIETTSALEALPHLAATIFADAQSASLRVQTFTNVSDFATRFHFARRRLTRRMRYARHAGGIRKGNYRFWGAALIVLTNLCSGATLLDMRHIPHEERVQSLLGRVFSRSPVRPPSATVQHATRAT